MGKPLEERAGDLRALANEDDRFERPELRGELRLVLLGVVEDGDVVGLRQRRVAVERLDRPLVIVEDGDFQYWVFNPGSRE